MRLFAILLLFFSLIWSKAIFGQEGYTKENPSLAYWTIGNSNEIIIVLHGGPTAGHNYLRPEWDQLDRFAKVVYYDQRGCGKSEKAVCYSWREYVKDLKIIIETVAKNKKVFLAGSSWGATLALLYVYNYPEDIKGIILSGTYNWIGKGEAVKFCAEYSPPHYLMDTIVFRNLTYLIKDTTKKIEKVYESHPYIHAFTNNSMNDAPTLIQLKTITAPVLIFKNSDDCQQALNTHVPLDGAGQFAAILENLELFTIEGACHDPWLTNKAKFFAKCNEFIERIKLLY